MHLGCSGVIFEQFLWQMECIGIKVAFSQSVLQLIFFLTFTTILLDMVIKLMMAVCIVIVLCC